MISLCMGMQRDGRRPFPGRAPRPPNVTRLFRPYLAVSSRTPPCTSVVATLTPLVGKLSWFSVAATTDATMVSPVTLLVVRSMSSGRSTPRMRARPALGTVDFEAYLPYRGSREESEWLEFGNLSVFKKYTEAFNIKSQSHELFSGCTGIGIERWASAFLAQNGLEPEDWPEQFKKEFGEMPEGIELM